MNKKIKTIASVVAGATILAAVILPITMPEQTAVYAKWFKRTGNSLQQDDDKAITAFASPAATRSEGETSTEIVIATKDGETQRVVIDEEAAAPVTVAIDKAVAEALQQETEKGQQVWLLDPVKVVQNSAATYGFDGANDTFTFVSQVYKGDKSGTGEASVLVKHGERYYLVQLIQPAGPGSNKVWQVQSIKEVRVTTTTSENKNHSIDVGPGVEGLDYDKVVRWQQNVDAGREMWRLEPLTVAKVEGRNYGFNDNDTYTVVRKLNSSTIARHGQIDVQVNHDGEIYTMIIVRPFGGDGAIWTIYKVIGQQPPATPPEQKILFETDKFSGWKWQKGQYPKDMAFATIVDYDAQLKNDNRIPESVLQKVKDVDFSNKVALFAYLGSGPSGGYGIGIEKVTMQGINITVQVRTKSPKPGDMVTMMMTYPSDYVLIDRNIVDVWGGINVTFVDQNGQTLSKNRLVIQHRN